MDGPVRDIAFDYIGKFSACVGDARDSNVKVLKPPTSGPTGICQCHTKRVIACDISKKPNFMATCLSVHSIALVKYFGTHKFSRHHETFVNDFRFSQHRTKLALASFDRKATIVDTASDEIIATLSGHAASVTGLSCSADNSKLLTSASD